jgi:Cu/Zn superoxide dismutase
VAQKAREYGKEKIMYRAKRLTGVALGAVFLVSLALAGSALAQGTGSATLQLTQSRDSGVSGTARFTSVEGGVEVDLRMRGLPEAGIEHINHIHAGGTCADDRAGRTAPVTIPLTNLVARDNGTGSVTTTIQDVTLDELFAADQERFILLHAETVEGQGVPPGIACADFTQRAGGEGVETLAPTGGTHPVVLLAIPLLLILAGTAGLLALWRRTT